MLGWTHTLDSWTVPGECERVPLKVRDLWTGEKDVLSSPNGGFLFLDLEFYDVGRMLDHLGYVGDVS
jgi:hypothetical protein